MRIETQRALVAGHWTVILLALAAGCPAEKRPPAPATQGAHGDDSVPGTQPETKPITVEMPVPADATEEPVLAIWVNHGFSMKRDPDFDTRTPRVIVLAWKDGRMIWSADPVQGGPPYRRGQADAASLQRLLDDLAADQAFAGGGFRWSSWGPDASFTVLALADGRRRLYMESWHELMEQHPNLVATAHGVTVLDDRTRDEMLADQPEEYRRARGIWARIRRGLNAMIPGPGEPAGEIEFELWKIEPPSND